MESRPTYKSAAELQIEQWEHDGLVALVGPLSRGELALEMARPVHRCGSPCCIGGWMNYFAGKETPLVISGACALFFPNIRSAYKATAPQAALAIVNFLVTGNPQWDAVMAETDATVLA